MNILPPKPIDAPAEENQATIQRARTGRGRAALDALQGLFRLDRKPLVPPDVDPDVLDLPATARLAESLRYNAASLEYSISPCGLLRAFMKMLLRVTLLAGLALCFAWLLTLPANLLAAAVASMAVSLHIATSNSLAATLDVVKIGAIGVGGLLLAKFFLRILL